MGEQDYFYHLSSSACLGLTCLSCVLLVAVGGGSILVLIFLVYMLASPPQRPVGVWKKIDSNVR